MACIDMEKIVGQGGGGWRGKERSFIYCCETGQIYLLLPTYLIPNWNEIVLWPSCYKEVLITDATMG